MPHRPFPGASGLQGKGSLDSAVLLVRLLKYSECVPGSSNVESVSRVNSGVDCWQFIAEWLDGIVRL
jgi:hypothetical protein